MSDFLAVFCMVHGCYRLSGIHWVFMLFLLLQLGIINTSVCQDDLQQRNFVAACDNICTSHKPGTDGLTKSAALPKQGAGNISLPFFVASFYT